MPTEANFVYLILKGISSAELFEKNAKIWRYDHASRTGRDKGVNRIVRGK